MSVAGYMQLRELTAVLALPPSLTASPFYEQSFLVADKALAFICFTSSSLHVAKYSRPGVGKCSILVHDMYKMYSYCYIPMIFTHLISLGKKTGMSRHF